MSRRACVLLLLPALSGCGGGNDEHRLSQSGFVSAANKVCIAADRRVIRIGPLSRNPSGWDGTARAARRGIAEMRRLHPPAERDAGFQRMLELAGGLEREVGAVGDALRKHRIAQARAAQLRATAFDTKVKKQAQRLGLTFCGQLLTNWPA